MPKRGEVPDLLWLECWRIFKNRHLYQWECDQRHKKIGWRTDIYRNVACRLAAKYQTLILEDIDLSKLAKRATDDKDDELTKQQRRHRFQCAPSTLRLALAQAFGKARTIIVPCKNDTRKCNHCGKLCDWDHIQLHHSCEHCGAEWDQDHNAGRNMLAAAAAGIRAKPRGKRSRKRGRKIPQ
jgi:transposase